jgi:hypothetical protein
MKASMTNVEDFDVKLKIEDVGAMKSLCNCRQVLIEGLEVCELIAVIRGIPRRDVSRTGGFEEPR